MVDLVLGILSWCIIIVLAEHRKDKKIRKQRTKERQANFAQFEKEARRAEDKRQWGGR